MGKCCSTVPEEHSYSRIKCNTESLSNIEYQKQTKLIKNRTEKCEVAIHSESRTVEYDESDGSNLSDQFIKVHVDESIIRPIEHIDLKETKYAQNTHCGSKSPSKIQLTEQECNEIDQETKDKMNGRTQTVQTVEDSISKASTSENIEALLQAIDQNTMDGKLCNPQTTENEPVFDEMINTTDDQIMAKTKPHKNGVITFNEHKDQEETDDLQTRNRKKSRHSVCTSYKIIDEYHGNKSIRELKKLYKQQQQASNHINLPMSKLSKTKSTHSVRRSKKIIMKYKNKELAKLKKKYKMNRIKTHKDDKKEEEHQDDNIDKQIHCSLMRKRTKSTHSIKRSSIIIGEYKGNEDIKILKSKYMKQYKKKKKRMSLSVIPSKPTNIDSFMNAKINCLHEELCEYVSGRTHYIGMAEFGDNKEVCIEIKFASNENGVITGKRTSIGNGNEIDGTGRIYKDVIWSEESKKYEGCIKFEWTDKDKKQNDLVTKLIFNSKADYMDMDHLYFEGQCYQYAADLNLSDDVDMEGLTNMDGISKGCFNMVCVSMRKRNIAKRNGLLKYHEIEIWKMDDEELQSIPKYIKCMNITSVKMHQCYADANPALSMLA